MKFVVCKVCWINTNFIQQINKYINIQVAFCVYISLNVNFEFFVAAIFKYEVYRLQIGVKLLVRKIVVKLVKNTESFQIFGKPLNSSVT